jgi:molybdate transport system regulatory protein
MSDRLEPRIRILLGSSIAIGPGKAALLEAIEETGSIAAAGRRMGMSYRRAWVLAKTMNACFREPLIEAAKGGIGGGGARLTPMGREVLALYRAMEDHAATAVITDMERLRMLMVDQPPRADPLAPICAKYHIGRDYLM